jgi:hypothetical protein
VRVALTATGSVIAALVMIATWVALRPPPAAMPFPCVTTSKTGQVSAATGFMTVIVEWGDTPVVGIQHVPGMIHWTEVSDADARRRARALLAPIEGNLMARHQTPVDVRVTCDGIYNGDVFVDEDTIPGYSCCLDVPVKDVPGCLMLTFVQYRHAAPGAAAEVLRRRMTEQELSIVQTREIE